MSAFADLFGPAPDDVPLSEFDDSDSHERDSRARRSVAEDLDRTLFVEAGAGTGKTTALVRRIVALVRSGVALANVAAITFTEKAAAELRERLRQELLVQIGQADTEEVDILRGALDELDGAAVCTLHSFAQRILREHTTEAGLPPRLEMLDEIGADMEFADAWDRFIEEMLADARMQRTLVLADALGTRMAGLRAVARRMTDNWDLAVERTPRVDELPEVPPLAFADLIEPMASPADVSRRYYRRRDGLSPPKPDDLHRAFLDLEDLARRLETAEELEALALLETVAGGPRPRGRKDHWLSEFNKEEARSQMLGLRDVAAERLNALGAACAARLLAALAEFTLAGAERRRRQGRPMFHDLLVLARDLLRHPSRGEAVRRSLCNRYQRLLIDEFQDTDPIQVELALLIAAGPSDGAGVTGQPDGDGGKASTAPHWRNLAASDGRLFFVGDPKQSLYRFRRADIGMYLQVADWAGPAARETLTRNWRSTPEIVDWVNAVFGRLIESVEGSQPDYVPLVAGRQRFDPRAGNPVLLLGVDTPTDDRVTADQLREREFSDVARLAHRAVAEGWQVSDGSGHRPIRLSDICILIPGRTVLGPLMDAFDTFGVPYRVESSNLVYGTRAETDLLAVLRAADDPSDHLAVVTALRSAAFGFGDDDLYRYRGLCGAGHRPWDYLGPQPDHPVAEALVWLEDLHTQRLWCSPGEIVDRVVRERRLMELAFVEDRHRDTWRRLRRAVDQARAFSDSTGGTLRAYLRWVDMQRSEGARVIEALVPETDDDSVRVMTVHAAKGLEFPFVVVAGFSSTSSPRRGPQAPALVFPSGGGAVGRLGGRVASVGFDAAAWIEETHEFHEDLRKLYVACTRARDHLAVCLHRTGRNPESWKKLSHAEVLQKMTLAELLTHAVAELAEPTSGDEVPHELVAARVGSEPYSQEVAALRWAALRWVGERWDWAGGRPVETLREHSASRSPAAADEDQANDAAAVPSLEEWLGEHERLWRFARRESVVAAGRVAAIAGEVGDRADGPAGAVSAATGEGEEVTRPVGVSPDPGLDKDKPEPDAPVRGAGRYGTSFGRAVHAVLQTVDLCAPDEVLRVAARRQAELEGIGRTADDVARRVRHALGSPVVREARQCRHWRELYAGAEIGGRLLEGFIDLLYEEPNGSLVVVDYKTHTSAEVAGLRQLPAYRLQIAAYALMLKESTGREVSRCVFVFLGPAGAEEVEVEDLPDAMAEIRGALTVGV